MFCDKNMCNRAVILLKFAFEEAQANWKFPMHTEQSHIWSKIKLIIISAKIQLDKSTLETFAKSKVSAIDFPQDKGKLGDLHRQKPTPRQTLDNSKAFRIEINRERIGFSFPGTQANTKHTTTSWKIHANSDKFWGATRFESNALSLKFSKIDESNAV